MTVQVLRVTIDDAKTQVQRHYHLNTAYLFGKLQGNSTQVFHLDVIMTCLHIVCYLGIFKWLTDCMSSET